MSGQRRRRLDAGAWREVLERFAAASMTVDEFCGREGLSTSSFYRWRERLQSAAAMQAIEPRLPRATGVAVRPNAAGFIELGSLAGSSGIDSGLELRLELGGGVVLQITRR